MRYSDTPKEPQRWLAEHWLPLDVVMVAAGSGGINKGRVACDIIASATTGADFFGGQVENLYDPMSVISITPEDRSKTAMRWRLEAAGADMSLVEDMTKDSLDRKRTISPANLDAIYNKACEMANEGPPVGLIYLDPLLGLLPKGKGISTNAHARENVIDPLDQLCEELGCGILLHHHTVKDGSMAGSVGLEQAARHVVGYMRGDRGICSMFVSKSNIGPDIEAVDNEGSQILPALRYRRVGSNDGDLKIEWIDGDEEPLPGPTLTSVPAAVPEPPQVQFAIPRLGVAG